MKTTDYEKYFVKGEFDETLRPCPCCGAKAEVLNTGDEVSIVCSHDLCKMVDGKTMADAVKLWNEPRFSESKV